MKKILPLIIGLILGLGGGTGYVMFLGGSEAPADAEALAEGETPEETAADSTHAGEEALAEANVDSIPEEEPEPALGSAAADLVSADQLAELVAAQEAQQAATADSQAAVSATEQLEAEVPQEAALALSASEDGEDEPAQRLAKIFGTMQARDAARVLSLLRHDEIERILRQLDDRSAAKILSSLDAELAAALSSNLIHGVSR